MSRIHEQLSARFHRWELRGRGWQLYEQPVYPEPPFVPFAQEPPPEEGSADDGRRPTWLSGFVQNLGRKLRTEPEPAAEVPEPVDEPQPTPLVRGELREFVTCLPADLDIRPEAAAHFLRNLDRCREPIAFELLGIAGRVTVQWAASATDAPLVHRQLQAYFPQAAFVPPERTLTPIWEDSASDEVLVVEFGLAHEFMFELAGGKLDPFVGLIGALDGLRADELGLFQVLFQAAQEPWPDSIRHAVTDGQGKPFFVNRPELTAAAERKIEHPLYAVVVRIAAKAETFERVVQISGDLAASLRVFALPQGNELIPLDNDGYGFEQHSEDVLLRQSRRGGMLLNSDELIGFVHLPASAVASSTLQREVDKTKAAPMIARHADGLLLGHNVHLRQTIPVRLTPDQRVRHCHIAGASGTGKSTLLFNLIQQDIENGEGVGVLDPHGDLVERILGCIPPARIEDVVLVDPSDEQFSVGFNILSAHSDLEKNLLASDLVSVFQRLSTSWGDQMASVLQKAILAFLESTEGGTLADLRRFLLEPTFREKFLKTVSDPDIVYYWRKGFAQLSGNKSIGPVLTRLETFLSPKPIRYMVSQPVNRLDFTRILDSGKIFLAKVPQGQIGKENAFLLGTLLVAKFQQLTMARQARRIEARRPFWLYIDEFQNFITPTMAEILTGARKYGLGLILAHQELRQLERDREVASAVLSNPYTRIVFRVGDADARTLEHGFSFFEARDFQNLPTGQAVCRVEKADGDFNLTIPLSPEIDPHTAESTRQQVIAASRKKYATPRADVEAMLREKLRADEDEPPPPKSKPKRPESSEPKDAEVPKATGSEKETPRPTEEKPVPPPAAAAPKPEPAPSPPADLGIGGAQHKAMQQRLKAEAQRLGFRATIEKEIANGSVDLLIEKDSATLACEISVTTTIDHEVGNVQKCLRAGFQHVVIICQEEARLRKIEAAVASSLGREILETVGFFQPDAFVQFLQELAKQPFASPPPAASESTTTRRGYKVKRKVSELTLEERKAREEAAIQQIAAMLKHRPPK